MYKRNQMDQLRVHLVPFVHSQKKETKKQKAFSVLGIFWDFNPWVRMMMILVDRDRPMGGSPAAQGGSS